MERVERKDLQKSERRREEGERERLQRQIERRRDVRFVSGPDSHTAFGELTRSK